MTKNEMIAALAAATMMHDDPDLIEFAAADLFDRNALIRDYRDEFASSPLDILADAKIDDDMIALIYDTLISMI